MAELEQNSLNERVSLHVTQTKNLGDFNSLKFDVGLSRDLKPGEKPSEAFAALRAGLFREIEKAFADALGE